MVGNKNQMINFVDLLKLYEAIYAHPRDNRQYSTVFLCGWLVQCKGHKINWIKYAYDCTQL
jgi:hypothetical protein